MTAPIKLLSNDMPGAPQLTNAWGAMTALLDACLVDGFHLKTINSLTSADGVATATISGGHQYRAGQVVSVSGASQSAYNGDFTVLSVTGTTFTYAVTGNPSSPATGTLASKTAPLGWQIAFTGTNKRAYRSLNVSSARPYLRVDDGLDAAYTTTYAKFAKVTMAEGMTDIDTFVGARAPYDPLAPTKNEVGTGSGTTAYNGWYKWYYAKAAANAADTSAPPAGNRGWCLVGDDRGFYLFVESIDGYGLGGKCFTDFASFRANDGYASILCAQAAYFPANTAPTTIDSVAYVTSDLGSRFPRTLDTTGKVLMRPYLQVGSNVNVSFTSLNTNNAQIVSGYSTGVLWPNGPDYGLILSPVLLKEGSHLRGQMPGMFFVHNDSPGLDHLEQITGVTGYPGRTFAIVKAAHGSGGAPLTAFMAFDITGPWW